jgi:hypothetical protein
MDMSCGRNIIQYRALSPVLLRTHTPSTSHQCVVLLSATQQSLLAAMQCW